MAQSILVTGGAGFIGSHIINQLVHERREVLVLDNLSSGKIENLAPQMKEDLVELIKGDVRDDSLVALLSSKVEAIVHLAAVADHEACLRDPEQANDVNARGTLVMLEAARKNDVKCVVYASSAALYGEPSQFPISEEAGLAPISVYGASKLAGEQHCLQYLQTYGLRAKCLRFFNVFGPRQYARQYSGVITEFMKRLGQNEPPIIFGDGLQTRDFVNIKDIVEATILALDSEQANGVYNIATGKETTINSLAETLSKVSGKALTPIHRPPRQGEIRRSVADISKAKTQLHFTPRTDLENDLGELWSWQQASTLDT